MARLMPLVLLLCATSVQAQRHTLWMNPGLSERRVGAGEQQVILRQDMSACHGAAFEGTRGVEDEQKRKALGVAVFDRCMSDRGWYPREASRGKPPSTKPKESST